MDTPRRWQIASVTTAVAGLGVGALLLGRPVTTSVPPIDLELVQTADRSADQGPDGAPPAPQVRPDPTSSDGDGGDDGDDERREVVLPDADAIDREASANSPADSVDDEASNDSE